MPNLLEWSNFKYEYDSKIVVSRKKNHDTKIAY